MTTRNRFIGLLFVLGQMVQCYLAQVSHVPSATVAQWTLHDWAGSLLFVGLAGITAAKGFLADPKSNQEKPTA